MKCLRTILLVDEGGISAHPEWAQVHGGYLQAIQSIDFPEGSQTLTLREKERATGGQWRRNGVKYLKDRFLREMVEIQGWQPEAATNLSATLSQPKYRLFPSLELHQEPADSSFGGFDFHTTTASGLRIAIEWETGNISSSHRSMNKLALSLLSGAIDAGILIVPSRDLYHHLTDRIGNISELSGYLPLWSSIDDDLERGLLAVSVVEHDFLTNDEEFPYLPSGLDGRAREGRAKRT